MDWLYFALLILILLCGLVLNVLTLPGNWLILLAVVVFTWVTGWEKYVSWVSLVALLVLSTLR